MNGHQRGRIYQASGKLYVQYRITENGKRVQRSHLLCVKDDRHRSKADRSVKLLRDEFMLSINSQTLWYGRKPGLPLAFLFVPDVLSLFFV